MIESLRDGVVLVGTAHVLPQSVADVDAAIQRERPDAVLVELDAARFQALRDPEAWQKTDIVRILREKKQHLFLLQLYLASVQARYGRETGSAPGAEMLRAVEAAEAVGAEVVLIDRDIAVTLKRGFGAMGFWARLRLFWKVWLDILTPAKGDGPVDLQRILETDAITEMTEEFARFAPQVKVALIDERDQFMASRIQEESARGRRVVAVVGAGHLPGIKRHLATGRPIGREALAAPPAPRLTAGKVIGWALPLAFVAVFVYLGVQGYRAGNFGELADAVGAFVLVTGLFSALGCALAFGHPLSIATAFVAAPFGVLHPLIATGWFAGLVEAKVRTPTVADFQGIKHVETLGQFWRNGVVRILLVTALTNVGAMVGSGIAGAKILGILGVA